MNCECCSKHVSDKIICQNCSDELIQRGFELAVEYLVTTSKKTLTANKQIAFLSLLEKVMRRGKKQND